MDISNFNIVVSVFNIAVVVVLMYLVLKVNGSITVKGEKGERGFTGAMGLRGISGVGLDSVEVKITNPMIATDSRFSIPTRATVGSAGIDLRACIDEPIEIKAGDSVLIGTGIAVHIKDPNFAGMILPRSGLGSKHGIVLGNLVGLIDSDYQGELMVSVWNRSWEDYTLEPATKFAQYMVVPVVTPQFDLVEEFTNESERGANGFGSTGIK